MKLSQDLEEKINTLKKFGLFTITVKTDKEPTIFYFGDMPYSEAPIINLRVFLYCQDKNCVIVGCANIIGEFKIEIKMGVEFVEELIRSDKILFYFCVDPTIENHELVCGKEQKIMINNSLDKNRLRNIKEYVEKNGLGDTEYALASYYQDFVEPPC